MIKVLQVTGAMNRGGAEVMIMDIFRSISNNIHFDFLINYNPKSGIVEGDFDKEIKQKKGKMYHIPTQWSIGPLKYYQEFKKIVQEVQPDIVHIHMNSKSGIIAWAAKKAGIKHVITHVHADIKFRGNFVYRSISNAEMKFQKILIHKYSDQYWGCSIEANNSLYFSTKLNQQNSAIINNAVDTDAYQEVSKEEVKMLRDSYQLKEQTFVIGNVGRVVRHKNVLFIIEVLKELIDQGVNCKFVYAGRADQQQYLDEIDSKIVEYNLQEKVIYLGLRSDIPTVMSTFDVFVGPALKEGFGLVAVEAQAAGVPCVLFKGFPKSVDMDLNLVIFLNDFSITEWVNAIVNMKKLKPMSKEVIKNKIIELGFDSATNTKQIEVKYLNMIQNTNKEV